MHSWAKEVNQMDSGLSEVDRESDRGQPPLDPAMRSAAGGVERGAGSGRCCAPPPANNMGVEFRIDWLTMTVEATGEQLAEVVEDCVGVEMVARGYGGNGYRECFVDHVTGAKVYCSPAHLADWQTRSTMMLPGKACEFLGVDGVRELLNRVETWFGRAVVNRVDLAFDQTEVDSAEVWDHLKSGGQVRTLAKRETFRRIEDMACKGTVYLGSRQSGRMLRVYDKETCCRFELECKKERAHAIVAHLMTLDTDEWAAAAWSHLLDYVDFGATWFAALKHRIGLTAQRAGLTLARRAQLSIERAEQYLMRQAAPLLAMFSEAKGDDSLQFLLSEGRRRYQKRHRVVLAACRV